MRHTNILIEKNILSLIPENAIECIKIFCDECFYNYAKEEHCYLHGWRK